MDNEENITNEIERILNNLGNPGLTIAEISHILKIRDLQEANDKLREAQDQSGLARVLVEDIGRRLFQLMPTFARIGARPSQIVRATGIYHARVRFFLQKYQSGQRTYQISSWVVEGDRLRRVSSRREVLDEGLLYDLSEDVDSQAALWLAAGD